MNEDDMTLGIDNAVEIDSPAIVELDKIIKGRTPAGSPQPRVERWQAKTFVAIQRLPDHMRAWIPVRVNDFYALNELEVVMLCVDQKGYTGIVRSSPSSSRGLFEVLTNVGPLSNRHFIFCIYHASNGELFIRGDCVYDMQNKKWLVPSEPNP